MEQRGWQLAVKRVVDRVAGGVALVAALPVLATTAAAIRVTLGSPVLFRQQRGGYRGSTFEVIKFRTMRDAVGPDGRPLPDEHRLTRFGSFLRATSLDELPQLINVVRGELSLVGPRPLVARYLERYTPEQARRHDVVPGMTGWAQINGRNAHDWPSKFRLDLWYVEHWSLWLDLKILVATVREVLRPTGVSNAGHATMPEFWGES